MEYAILMYRKLQHARAGEVKYWIFYTYATLIRAQAVAADRHVTVPMVISYKSDLQCSHVPLDATPESLPVSEQFPEHASLPPPPPPRRLGEHPDILLVIAGGVRVV